MFSNSTVLNIIQSALSHSPDTRVKSVESRFSEDGQELILTLQDGANAEEWVIDEMSLLPIDNKTYTPDGIRIPSPS